MRPLNRAANARHLFFWPLASFGNLYHRIEKFGRAAAVIIHTGIVKAATILQLPIFIETEEIWCADRTISFGNLLTFIHQIGERETKMLGKLLHKGGTIRLINPIIIRHDRKNIDAHSQKFFRVSCEP